MFQVQEVASSRTLYIRHAGLADAATGAHETSERVRLAPEPLASEAGAFRIEFGDSVVAGDNGESYRLTGRVGGTAYDLTLRSEADPLAHHDDGLVDFREAGVTYYYSRPRLAAAGTVTPAGGAPLAVVGLGWFDKQWGNFQPVAVGWDWASAQLDSGADLMLTRLFDGEQRVIDAYATLRQPGAAAMLLGADDFVFSALVGELDEPAHGNRLPYPVARRRPGRGHRVRPRAALRGVGVRQLGRGRDVLGGGHGRSRRRRRAHRAGLCRAELAAGERDRGRRPLS